MGYGKNYGTKTVSRITARRCKPFWMFSGAGFELMALACGLSYMFSGYHSLYSSQGFRTSKLFSEFLQPKEEK